MAKRKLAWLVLVPVLAIGLMIGFGLALAGSQRQAHSEVQARFHDRAVISAQLIESVFEASAVNSQTTAAARLGSAHITPRSLAATARSLQLGYAQVLDAQGRLLAATPGAPAPDRGAPSTQAGLGGHPRLSDLQRGPGGPTVAWAVPFRSRHGRRVLVEGLTGALIEQFLSTVLGRTPSPGGASFYVVDDHGVVLGTAHGPASLGTRVPEVALARVLSTRRSAGEYGDGLYFTAAAVPTSSWRVVIRAHRDRVLASVTGSRRTIPWAIFVAFALSVLLGLVLLSRVMRASREVQRRELSQRHAVEINDNIIQRLVLATYALERGEHAASQRRLGEALSEAQRLVNDLLAEQSLLPGSLRRHGPASVSDR